MWNAERGDVAFWTAGIACMDMGAVMPVFVSTLTRSKLLIALLGMMPGVGWTLLQIVGAAHIMHRPRKKGFLLAVAAMGRQRKWDKGEATLLR